MEKRRYHVHAMRLHGGGFTLIELLVVVAIIGLLIAILLPGLGLAQQVAEKVICKTQMNQLMLGIFVYTEENEGTLPYFAWYAAAHDSGFTEWWATQVSMSMEVFERDLFRCPSDEFPFQVDVYKSRGGQITMSVQNAAAPVTTSMFLSYRGSCDLVEQVSSTPDRFAPRKITSFSNADTAILLVEGRKLEFGSKECYRFLDDLWPLRWKTDDYDDPLVQSWIRHLEMGNYLFMDGHIESLDLLAASDIAREQEHFLSFPGL